MLWYDHWVPRSSLCVDSPNYLIISGTKVILKRYYGRSDPVPDWMHDNSKIIDWWAEIVPLCQYNSSLHIDAQACIQEDGRASEFASCVA